MEAPPTKNPLGTVLFDQKFHQKCRDSEPCNLVFGYFGGEVFPCISLIYTAYIGQYLHFRHLNFFVTYLPILGCGWRCLCIFLFIFTHGNTLLTPFHICPLSPESGSLEQANIEITWIYPPRRSISGLNETLGWKKSILLVTVASWKPITRRMTPLEVIGSMVGNWVK